MKHLITVILVTAAAAVMLFALYPSKLTAGLMIVLALTLLVVGFGAALRWEPGDE